MSKKGNIIEVILIAIAVGFIVWILLGGPGHKDAANGPFITPLSDTKNPSQPYGPAN